MVKPVRLISFAQGVLLFLMLCGSAFAMPEKPLGCVSDFANVLDAKAKADILEMIQEVEQKTTCEIAVVTVSTLDGLTVEEYANQLFKKWGIGKKGKDNGVLLLVASNDRKVRIEVGYGVESVLPDGLCGQIIREACLPNFKENNFNKGVSVAVARIGGILTGDVSVKTYYKNKADVEQMMTYFKYIFFSLVFLFGANGFDDTKSTRRAGGRFWTWIVSFLTIASWGIGYLYLQFFASMSIDNGQFWAIGIFTGWVSLTCMWEAGVHLREKRFKDFWIDFLVGLGLLATSVAIAWSNARLVVYCLGSLSLLYFFWGCITGFLESEPKNFIERFILWLLVFRSAFMNKSDKGHAERYGFRSGYWPSSGSGGGSSSSGGSFGGGSSGGGGASGSW